MSSHAPFSFSCPTQVVFGEGVSAEIAAYLPEGVGHVAVVRGRQGDDLIAKLRQSGVTVHEVSCPSEPTVSLINDLVAALSDHAIEAVIACGGGSVMDTGKALVFCLSNQLVLTEDFSQIASGKLRKIGQLPLLAVPTTAGTGSEVTLNAVLELPAKQAKVSLRGRALAPSVALVDPALMISAPQRVALYSGLDAVVQTLEAYTSNAATPFSDAITAPNIEIGLRAVRDVVERGDRSAWGQLAWVSLCSGLALANGGLGAAHGLASVVGGRSKAPHGALCGLFLTPVLRQNLARSEAGSDARARLGRCCEAVAATFPPVKGADPLSGLEAWSTAHSLPKLSEYAIREADLAAIAGQSVDASSSKKNAVELTRGDYLHILQTVF